MICFVFFACTNAAIFVSKRERAMQAERHEPAAAATAAAALDYISKA